MSFIFLHKNVTFWRWPFFPLFWHGITQVLGCTNPHDQAWVLSLIMKQSRREPGVFYITKTNYMFSPAGWLPFKYLWWFEYNATYFIKVTSTWKAHTHIQILKKYSNVLQQKSLYIHTFKNYLLKRVKSHFTYFEKHWRVFDSSMAQRSVSDWATVVRAACYQSCVHCGTTGSVLSLGVLPAPVFWNMCARKVGSEVFTSMFCLGKGTPYLYIRFQKENCN